MQRLFHRQIVIEIDLRDTSLGKQILMFAYYKMYKDSANEERLSNPVVVQFHVVGEARNYLVPFELAYYVPRVNGQPILPKDWKPAVKEADLKLEFIVPAFATVPYSETQTVLPQEPVVPVAALKSSLEKVSLRFERVRIQPDTTRFYGSVNVQDIVKALRQEHLLVVDKEAITIPEGKLKTLGQYSIEIKVGSQVVSIPLEIADVNE